MANPLNLADRGWRAWHDGLSIERAAWIIELRDGDAPNYEFRVAISAHHAGQYMIEARKR
jgi:hypothetical protein